ncbi:MAG: hypothetical protein IEMM0003_0440 [bacterium]|nr:MAG: hypothetical protein IEMM0003_0440 [bacterium]
MTNKLFHWIVKGTASMFGPLSLLDKLSRKTTLLSGEMGT